jgi:hydroxymethylglutaryl-CoA reductase (NADPH)
MRTVVLPPGTRPAGPPGTAGPRIPRDGDDDYHPAILNRRLEFVEEFAGVRLKHLRAWSFDPRAVRGNCEQFIGVAQVPIGIAGPLRIEGEYARGDYLIPLATSEGTLVASYNRGMQALNAAGGVHCTVVEEAMQRAPVFVLSDARRARELAEWVRTHEEGIRAAAEATSRHARLLYVDPYLSNHFVFLRFNFETGDAAGQNMVTRATAAACNWILGSFAGIRRFHLESNFASDKKTSRVNMLRTRGKRVTAEARVPGVVLRDRLRTRAESLLQHYRTAGVGAFMAGTNNNGLHAANALAALFIATGQDVANVAESSAAIVYADEADDDGIFLSITLPSLIVGTHGGGTGLPTPRECLEILGCVGPGRVRALAEIAAGVVLAGELSLAAAIAADEWVAAHERLGRNR